MPLSIIIPAYNEAERIGTTLDSIARYFSAHPIAYEVIVVDDGSTDDTAQVAKKWKGKIENLIILVNDCNYGKGYSVRRGMLESTGERRLFMDADNSIDISHLPAFMTEIEKGSDVVIGSIHMSDQDAITEHNGSHRRILGALANALIQTLAVRGISDTQRGFKLFTAESAERIFSRQTIERWGFDIETLVIARHHGFIITELPVVWDNPAGSKVGVSSYVGTLGELMRITYNRVLGRYDARAGEGIRPIIRNGRQVGFRARGKEFVHYSSIPLAETAYYNLLSRQKRVLLGVIALIAIAFAINWHLTLIVLFATLTVLYFCDLLFGAFIIYRSHRSSSELRIGAEDIARLRDEDCPRYTVFCPLYKEWQVVPQFVAAMGKMDYPVDKLQIMFLLEENDAETVEKIRGYNLPSHFEIVVVPHSVPKTKPKAMNYGLDYATGTYIVVYDAEDVPEPDQIKKAVLAFRRVDDSVTCIQAKLNFYNPEQNVLTRLFTTEYSLWFDLMLPGFQSIAAPIPLGGTSNHFRADRLRELGGWDGFNVTEDCDLGMRLARHGYRTAIVDSTTYEEANSDALNWYNQRSRWIKGYIQTYLVHMRDIGRYVAEGRVRNLILFQFIVGGKILSLFVNPIMWIITILYFAFRAQTGEMIETLFPGPVLYIGVFSLLVGNFLYLYYYMVGCVKREYDGLIKYTALIPIYWLSMSLAAWKALYEVIVKPHYWSKTVHGLHLAPAATAAREVVPESETKADTEQLEDMLDVTVAPVSRLARARAFAISSAGLLVLSSIIANGLNFVFNAFLGRALTLADFGTITMINALIYLLSLFTGALSTTVTYEVSYHEGKKPGSGNNFLRSLWPYVLAGGGVGTMLWFLGVERIGEYFQVSETAILWAFAPIIIIAAIDALNRGYLQGVFRFESSAAIVMVETLSKLALAGAFVYAGYSSMAAFSIPLSIVIACALSTVLAIVVYRSVARATPVTGVARAFPFGFYAAAFVSGVSVAAFLTTDIILAKHFLSPDDAGRYGLLSLVGKMIFFFGTLLNMFIVPVVSRALSEGKDTDRAFAPIFAGSGLLTIGSGAGLTFLGSFLVPFLFGEKAISIVPFVPTYALAITLFALSTTMVAYGLALKRYIFPFLSLAMSLALWQIISTHHDNIGDFVSATVLVNVFAFVLIAFVTVCYTPLRFVARNVRDAVLVFAPLPLVQPMHAEGKRILIYNWRDSESVFAGGAETYIHNLAERWVRNGHAVTLFTSNDGTQKPDGIINGIQIVRRGGFFVVYALAPLYHFFKFRGRFDVVVDCENGIPFFTPLYASEPVYCLVHHIHQDVFRRSLSWPLAALASSLEKDLMPIVYRNSSFITVSESSKRDILALGITDREVEIVYPGVDLDFLSPAGAKTATCQIAYIGRLKEYKSIPVLLRAFAQVRDHLPNARLVIAGGGEEKEKLERIARKLGIIERVDFLGKVSEERKREIMRESWACVNPSMMEGWGITVIEANACATPVIAADVPGLRESVRHGETGILVPHGDSEALAMEILSLAGDASRRSALAHGALAWARTFDWQKSSERFISLISHEASALSEQRADVRVRHSARP